MHRPRIASPGGTGHPARVLHGSPHDANMLSIDGQPLFIAFETVAVGPLDSLPTASRRADARHLPDPRLSAQVAIWCWAGAARSPELRWHATHRLAAVKRATG
jgi:hypothetical protein